MEGPARWPDCREPRRIPTVFCTWAVVVFAGRGAVGHYLTFWKVFLVAIDCHLWLEFAGLEFAGWCWRVGVGVLAFGSGIVADGMAHCVGEVLHFVHEQVE